MPGEVAQDEESRMERQQRQPQRDNPPQPLGWPPETTRKR
jgi:hypothetical protein